MQNIFLKVIPPGLYIYICLYIFETVLRQFRGRALLCENAVLGTCDGEHVGCVNICRKVHEAVPRQFRGRALLCNDEVLGTCDGEHGFLRRVSNNFVFLGILGIRGPPSDAVLCACHGEHGFLHRVSQNMVFIRIPSIRGPPQAFPMLALLCNN